MIRLGAHLSIVGGIHNALIRANELKFNTVQIFSANNNRWAYRKLSDKEIELFKKYREEFDINPVVVHSGYLLNMANPDNTIRTKTKIALKNEIIRCGLIGADYFVIHPGAHKGFGNIKGMDNVIELLNEFHQLILDNRVMLCIETTAGQGTYLGKSFEEIGYIITESRIKIGFCLDTAHIFAAGYSFSNENEINLLVDEIEKYIGFDRLKVIHLNDSLSDFNSYKDRHYHIGEGKIGLNSFKILLNHPKFHNIPLIMETPKTKHGDEDIKNKNTVLKLLK